MTISAIVVADSVSPQGHRLTTFKLRYPRFIHAEELTHRLLETSPEILVYETVADGLMYDQTLSRNASSSRAIPVERMIKDILDDTAMPVYWGSHKPGMQAGEELTGEDLAYVKAMWLNARDDAIHYARKMVNRGLHKQIANRVLEPYGHINVVVTATSWANFFALRAHADAQPEIKALADAMLEAMNNSTPKELHPTEWHLPFIRESDWDYEGDFPRNQLETLKKVSVARCARVSYLTHDGRETTVEEDVALYEKLVVSQPLHASPAEHQATPDKPVYGASVPGVTRDYVLKGYANHHEHGNFTGWRQLRKMLDNEFVSDQLYRAAD